MAGAFDFEYLGDRSFEDIAPKVVKEEEDRKKFDLLKSKKYYCFTNKDKTGR
jgi:hypothetical protein